MTEAVVESPDAARERHANNLELFLDLVFVFAITQIASTIAADTTVRGVAQGLLLAWLVWWHWSQFTWTGAAIDLQANASTRILVLCMVPFALLMTVSIPEAYGDNGIWFAATYIGVLVVVLVIQASVSLGNAATRASWIRYASVASLAPVFVLVGAFFDGAARPLIWCGAVVAALIGAMRAGSTGEWHINPVHFAERHALFVIISLGEVLVSVGATAAAKNLSAIRVTAVVVSVVVACVLWWIYFAFIPTVTEHSLRMATPRERGSLARDVFTFGHFPLVVGLILYALVAKHIVQFPAGKLKVDDRWMLAGSVVFFIGGLMANQWRVVRRVAPERFVAILVVCGLCIVGGRARSIILVALVAVVLAAMQIVTLRRLNGRTTT
ncbi:MAG: low temperature requirement protein A [Actinobacteria bacterium]|nr:low temperature requirement protein A [Actinomycetota bacterium]